MSAAAIPVADGSYEAYVGRGCRCAVCVAAYRANRAEWEGARRLAWLASRRRGAWPLAKGWGRQWWELSAECGQGGCERCEGAGRVGTAAGCYWRPCGCVLREAFRSVWAKRAELLEAGPWMAVNANWAWSFSRRREEFLADAEMVARRALPGTARELFEMRAMKGLHWMGCARRMGLGRTEFFRAEGEMQERIGRAFAEEGLFPAAQYFTRHSESRPAHLVKHRDGVWRVVS